MFQRIATGDEYDGISQKRITIYSTWMGRIVGRLYQPPS